MKFNIFKESIIGYKNLIKGSLSQDYIDCKQDDKFIICSVADGHSTTFFKHSLDGAKFACEASIKVLSEIVDIDIDKIEDKLINYEIQKNIDKKWRDLVEEHYKKIYPNVFKIEYIKYATTLLSVLITDKFILYLKLGDGDIVVKRKNSYICPIKTRTTLEVDSLGRKDEYEHILYRLENRCKEDDISVILFTDGYSNAFKNKCELFYSIGNTLEQYNKNIFSRFMLFNTYENYLTNISKNLTHDDISIVFIV